MSTDASTSTGNECKVKLKGSDEKIFEVDYAVAVQSQFVKNLVEDVGTDMPVPLLNVSSETLAKVIEYCEYHVNVQSAGNMTISEVEGKKWDEEFVKVKLATLFHLMNAAKYLDICNLLDLVAQAIADRIKWASPEEMRKIFNIENDFTPEEEAEVRREVEWAFQ